MTELFADTPQASFEARLLLNVCFEQYLASVLACMTHVTGRMDGWIDVEGYTLCNGR